MKKALFIITLIYAGLCCMPLSAQSNTISTYEIEDPKIMEDSFIKITADWDFFWGKFVLPYDKTTQPDLVVSVPSSWNKYELSEEIHEIAKTGCGSGTYRLKITNLYPNTKYVFPVYKLAYTAFKIYANNKKIYETGTPSVNWENTIAEQYFETAGFTSDKNGEVILTFLISNKFYRKGGLRGTLSLYEEDAYNVIHKRKLCSYSIFYGILFIIIIYCLLIFLLKKEKSSLYLSLLVFSLFSRIFFSTFPLIKTLFPGIPFTLMLKCEYISVYFIPAFMSLYVDSLDKSVFKYIPAKIIAAPGFLFFVLDFVLPIKFANRLVPYNQVYMYTVIFLDSILFLISFIKKHDFVIAMAFISLAIVSFGASSELFIIQNISILKGVDLLSPSFVLFALCQIVVLAYLQNRNYMKVIELNECLIETNKAYYRFVPKEFLELLSKKDITEVELGEHKLSKAAILSADIRNFTSTSEKLLPVQVFDMLNSYLHRVAPLIRKYNGIIEKYLGDGMIAIFPDSAEAALNCAIEMQEQMIELRKDFEVKGIPQIKIGIGVHYGNIIIGTGGNNDRMTEISLSDDIDIAVKTEALTKEYHHPILATYQAIRRAANEARAAGEKFSFCGEKIASANDNDTKEVIFSIYNEKIGDVL